MKKQLLTFGALVAVATMVASCGSTRGATGDRSLTTAYTPVVLMPKFVDYEVNLKEKTSVVLQGKLKKDETLSTIVNQASIQAINESGSDFLFEPNMDVETRGMGGRKYKIVLTGYPAKYVSTRPVNFKDSLEVQFYQKQYQPKLEMNEIQGSKKKSFHKK